jgi:hypothetical protein
MSEWKGPSRPPLWMGVVIVVLAVASTLALVAHEFLTKGTP